jgi:hypothetical protein
LVLRVILLIGPLSLLLICLLSLPLIYLLSLLIGSLNLPLIGPPGYSSYWSSKAFFPLCLSLVNLNVCLLLKDERYGTCRVPHFLTRRLVLFGLDVLRYTNLIW